MTDDAQGRLRRAPLGTIAFVLLVPGSVVVLGPWLLTGCHPAPPLFGWRATRWLGGVLIVLALPVFAAFTLRFVVEGHGTPVPIAPTEHLVVGGPFRWVRNPGYISVVALLLGQALVFGSPVLLAYAAVGALGFHLFVVFYEEPTLRRQFGAEYEAYCRAVRRWIPRPRPAPSQPK
jgi:protein-S-isoprenylcysteine O-methyltransferase Ste14